ncbi:MAG: molybdopterin-dependent oxidoreductase [Halanaeroarchaeum sp.]
MAKPDRLRDYVDAAQVTVAIVAGVLAVSGSYLVAGPSTSFVAVPINRLVVRFMPGAVVTFSILVLGKLGELVGFALAIGLTGSLFALGSLAVVLWTEDVPRRLVGTGIVSWVIATVLTRDPVLALGAAIPPTAAVALEGWVGDRGVHEGAAVARSRRRVLALAAGSIGFAGLSSVLGGGSAPAGPGEPLGDTAGGGDHTTTGARTGDSGGMGAGSAMTTTESVQSAIADRLAEARARSLDVDGLHGLNSDVESFYTVDIDSVDPSVDRSAWTLTVEGAVEEPMTLDFEALRRYDGEHRFVTLRCVGDDLNGRLMDNALWTGIPVEAIFEAVKPTGSFVTLRAVDDYYESFPIEALRPGLLAYGMNGKYLPRAHGHPVRALVPGHWGEVNVKWLSAIEVTEAEQPSYWERRGWHGTGPVHTVAKLWTVNHRSGGDVQVGGYAYAGTRGIRTVEVSTDGGETWNAARLSEPLADADVWRQWAYTWTPTAGSQEVVVRAVDGTGTVQPREHRDPFPSGATGWVSRTVDTDG